jgi:hypothetical protein
LIFLSFLALAIYRCLLEVLFVQQFLWTPFIGSSHIYDNGYQSTPYYCHASSLSGWLAFVAQFGLLGSELCFLIISWDLRLAYTNPFSSYKQNRMKYIVLVISLSLATAILLILCGDQVYGPSSLGLIWIQSRRAYRSPNYPKALLFYGFNVAIFVYCIWANFQFYRGSEKGFSKTVSNRLSIMKRAKRYTAAYVIYECLVLFIELISFATESDPTHPGALPAYFYSLRGVCGLLIIVYSNYSELSWSEMNPFRFRAKESEIANVAKERLLLQPHLNSALRAEILYFTTQGIRFAALEYEKKKGGTKSLVPTEANALLEALNGKNNGKSSSITAIATKRKTATTTEAQNNNNNNNNNNLPNTNTNNNTVEDETDDQRMYSFDTKGMRPSESAGPLSTMSAPGGQTTGPQSFLRGIRRSFLGTSNINEETKKEMEIEDVYNNNDQENNNNNNNNNAKTSEEEDEEEQQYMRNTITQLDELQKRQENFISRVKEAAYLDEIENIGYNPEEVLKNPDPVKLSSAANKKKSLKGGPAAAAAVAKSNANPNNNSNFRDSDFSQELYGDNEEAANKDSFVINNPLRSSNMSNNGGNGGRGAGGEFELSPRVSKSGGSSNSNGNAVGNKKSDLSFVREESIGSETSESTVKWRDTMDVEFGIRYSNNTVRDSSDTSSNNPNSDMPSWKRLKGTGGSVNYGKHSNALNPNNNNNKSVGKLDRHSEESDESMSSSSSLRRVLESAVSSASLAAKSLFNPAYKEFRFKDFCPKLFARVRELHGIGAQEYAKAFEITCRERFSEGRSGAFMFFSGNQKCIVKTTSSTESFSLRRIMPKYVDFLEENPNSLIVRFIGCHCITMYGNELYFVVMLNVFPTVPLSERYDLKGSWVNRHGFHGSRKTRSERLRREQIDSCPLYQDNDLQHSISLETQTALGLADQIKRDVLFLEGKRNIFLGLFSLVSVCLIVFVFSFLFRTSFHGLFSTHWCETRTIPCLEK